MPVYDFKCAKCATKAEVWRSFDDESKELCECGGEMKQCITLWANTPGRWGDSTGYFDRGLGTYVENYVHRDMLMKEKGLVPTTQQDQMDHQHAVNEEHKQHQKDVEKFTEVYKKTNSSAEAAAAAFPCNDI